MDSSARVVAELAGDRTRLTVLRGEAALLPRRTLATADDPAGGAVVHLVGGAAGPLGGDRLHLEVCVGPGAELIVRTVAASVALPGSGASRFTVRASVADGGYLAWLPEPVIAAGRCDHTLESTVELLGDARLVWREELVCGRYGEEPGDLLLATVVRRDGVSLLRQELAIGPRSPGWAGGAVLGGHRATGSLLRVGLPPPTAGPGPLAAHLTLAGGGVLTAAVAPDAVALRQALAEGDGRPSAATE